MDQRASSRLAEGRLTTQSFSCGILKTELLSGSVSRDYFQRRLQQKSSQNNFSSQYIAGDFRASFGSEPWVV